MRDTNPNPIVSVLLPVFNASEYIEEAIKSILDQTFTNFELIIIDDGSTDRSIEVINAFKDSRIRLISHAENAGIVKALNRGIDEAIGAYIVRMDADDISLPNRIEEQVKFMFKNSEIGISGTQVIDLRRNRKHKKSQRFTKPADVKANLLYQTSLAHPTVIMRRSMIDKFHLRYSEDYPFAEDREFWFRATQKFPIANINRALLLYRKHDQNLSSRYSDIQLKSSKKIAKEVLQQFDIYPSVLELELHQSLSLPLGMDPKAFISFHQKWFEKLIDQNRKKNWCNAHSLKKIIVNRWSEICRTNDLGVRIFLSNPHFNLFNRRDLENLIKCVLK